MAFSDILKYLREEREITQKELAKACNLSSQCICALEQGTRNPTGTTVAALAAFFGVSADYLLELENDYGVKTSAPMGERLTASERELLSNFRKLSPYLQGIAINTVRGLTGAGAGDLHKKA